MSKKHRNKNKSKNRYQYRDVVEYYGSKRDYSSSHYLKQTKPEDIRSLALQIFGSLYVDSSMIN